MGVELSAIFFGIGIGIALGVLLKDIFSFESTLVRYNNWAEKQFPKSTSKSSLEGLKKEIIEVEDELNKPYSEVNKEELGLEYVDCMMYLIDGARRAGINEFELIYLFRKKLKINKNRSWNINEDKSY